MENTESVRVGNTPTLGGKLKAVHAQAGKKQSLRDDHHSRSGTSAGSDGPAAKPHTDQAMEEKQPHGGFGVAPASFPESHYGKNAKTTRRPNAVKPRVGNQPHTK